MTGSGLEIDNTNNDSHVNETNPEILVTEETVHRQSPNTTLAHAFEMMDDNLPHVLEFGVYKGQSIRQIRSSLSTEKFQVFGFDSFEGLPEDWVGTELTKGFFSTNNVIPDVVDVKFYAGWFKDTIPQYLQSANFISLLHVDCDLYSSTVEILYSLTPWIRPGTIIVFDEWYYNHVDIEENRQHEQKAFFEWVKDKNISYEILPEIECERRIVKILDMNC